MNVVDITDEEEFIKNFKKQFEYARETNKTFKEMVEPIISHTNSTIFCEKTDLSPATFSRFKIPVNEKTGKEYKPSVQALVAFCVGYEIDLPNAIAIRRSYGYTFNITDPVEYAYMYLITHYSGRPISECNALLKKLGIEEKFLLRENSK